MSTKEVLKALAVTAEIYNRSLSDDAAEAYVRDLDGFKPEAVLAALTLCRRELRTFPTIADILSRIQDGRPGQEEAWALMPRTEAESVVWTEEMRDAFASIRFLLAEDPIAARMAFKETYARLIQTARNERRTPVWIASLGTDKTLREGVLARAVALGRLPADYAKTLLPDVSFSSGRKSPELSGPTSIASLVANFEAPKK